MKAIRSIALGMSAVGLFTTGPAFSADSPHSFTGSVTLTSDYVFRGVSQTQNGPAVQAGLEYAHASGLYIGTFGSNVSWVSVKSFKDSTGADVPGTLPFKESNSMELDLYAGYRGSAGDFGYDLGAITYYYPGKKVSGIESPDTTEVYLGGSWKWLSAKYSHVVSKNFIGWYDYANQRKSRGSNYIELNANYDLGDGWSLQGHVGRQKVKNVNDASYTDWKLGVSKDLGFGVVSLAYTDTNAKDWIYTWSTQACSAAPCGEYEKVADGRLIVSFTKSF